MLKYLSNIAIDLLSLHGYPMTASERADDVAADAPGDPPAPRPAAGQRARSDAARRPARACRCGAAP